MSNLQMVVLSIEIMRREKNSMDLSYSIDS